MFKSISEWYDRWEQEQLDVLADPSLVAGVQPGYRRYCAQKLAELSPIERQELREFSITYQGRRLWIASAKLIAGFSLAGLLVHLLVPSTLSLPVVVMAANMLGFCALMAVVSVWFNYRKVANRKLQLAGFIIGCAIAGALVGVATAVGAGDKDAVDVLAKLPRTLAIITLGAGGLVVAPLLIIGALRNRRYEALTVQLQLDAERERMARELSESQLRLLRAQIEPHFLFNTLGAVQQLAEQGAPRAAELTANLIDFLRASLAEMRNEQASLGDEFRMIEAYLKVMQARLGERLRYSVSLPEALAHVSVPSMVLLTLVENAIKHGIEPALRGGEVQVSGQQAGDKIAIRIRDTGAGMSPVPGAGVGLDNVRRRLQLAYGGGASLALEDHGDGVVAEVTLPLESKEAAA
jgi:signal transduction histidine kinase